MAIKLKQYFDLQQLHRQTCDKSSNGTYYESLGLTGNGKKHCVLGITCANDAMYSECDVCSNGSICTPRIMHLYILNMESKINIHSMLNIECNHQITACVANDSILIAHCKHNNDRTCLTRTMKCMSNTIYRYDINKECISIVTTDDILSKGCWMNSVNDQYIVITMNTKFHIYDCNTCSIIGTMNFEAGGRRIFMSHDMCMNSLNDGHIMFLGNALICIYVDCQNCIAVFNINTKSFRLINLNVCLSKMYTKKNDQTEYLHCEFPLTIEDSFDQCYMTCPVIDTTDTVHFKESNFVYHREMTPLRRSSNAQMMWDITTKESVGSCYEVGDITMIFYGRNHDEKLPSKVLRTVKKYNKYFMSKSDIAETNNKRALCVTNFAMIISFCSVFDAIDDLPFEVSCFIKQ